MIYELTAPTAYSWWPYAVSPEQTVRVRPRLTSARIKDVVSAHYGMRRTHMESGIRWQAVSRPRQVAMYLTRELTGKSTPAIGRLFGDRDHTTVLHALKRVTDLMRQDADFAADVELLRERLTG